jgi:pimeloyl-ACP methyl ester carboxylesterase
MGGFNAAQYYFKRPDVFAKVAIVCPAFTLWGPQSSKEEVQDYIKRNNANEGRVKWLRAGLKAFFPKPADWANGDVFQLVDRLTPQEAAVAPPLYLSCGTEDDFGFYEGSSKMAEALSARKVNMIWEPVPGAHCSRPYQQVAEFFMDSKDPETQVANSNE